MGIFDDELLGPSMKTAAFLGYVSAQNRAADAMAAAAQSRGTLSGVIAYAKKLQEIIKEKDHWFHEQTLDLNAANQRIAKLLELKQQLIDRRDELVLRGYQLDDLVEAQRKELAQSKSDLQNANAKVTTGTPENTTNTLLETKGNKQETPQLKPTKETSETIRDVASLRSLLNEKRAEISYLQKKQNESEKTINALKYELAQYRANPQ